MEKDKIKTAHMLLNFRLNSGNHFVQVPALFAFHLLTQFQNIRFLK